jgi:hypothetical protein
VSKKDIESIDIRQISAGQPAHYESRVDLVTGFDVVDGARSRHRGAIE